MQLPAAPPDARPPATGLAGLCGDAPVHGADAAASILQEGAAFRGVAVLREGSAAVLHTGGFGAPAVLQHVGPGSVLAADSLLTGRVAAELRALRRCRYVLVPGELRGILAGADAQLRRAIVTAARTALFQRLLAEHAELRLLATDTLERLWAGLVVRRLLVGEALELDARAPGLCVLARGGLQLRRRARGDGPLAALRELQPGDVLCRPADPSAQAVPPVAIAAAPTLLLGIESATHAELLTAAPGYRDVVSAWSATLLADVALPDRRVPPPRAGEAEAATGPAPAGPRSGAAPPGFPAAALFPLVRAVRRQRFFVPQIDEADCGVACVAMALRRAGLIVPVEEMRQMVTPHADGMSIQAVLALARQYGLDGRGIRTGAPALSELSGQIVLNWPDGHWVLLVGDGAELCIADPLRGLRRIARPEFEATWNGYAVQLWPMDAPAPAAAAPERALRGAALLRPALAGGAGLIVPASALFAAPALARLPPPDLPVWSAGGSAIALALAASGLAAAVAWFAPVAAPGEPADDPADQPADGSAGNRGQPPSTGGGRERPPVRPSGRRWRHTMIAAGRAEQAAIARLRRRTGGPPALAVQVQTWSAAALATAAEPAVGAALLFGLAGVGLLGARAAGGLTATSNAVDWMRRQHLRAISELLRLGRYRAAGRPWLGDRLDAVGRIRTRLQEAAHAAGGRVWTLLTLCGLLTALVSGLAAATQSCASAGATACADLAAALALTCVALVGLPQVALGGPAWRSRAEPPAGPAQGAGGQERPPAPVWSGAFSGEIRLRNVGHRWHADGPAVLDGVDLDIPAGHCVAVLGPNGAGKSTLARILADRLVPASGTVLYDGSPADPPGAGDVAGRIGLLEETEVPPGGSVLEVIGGGAAELRLVQGAARVAGLEPFIAALPYGYETRLPRDPAALARHERLRLALARAVYGNPSALVLDSDFAAFDDRSFGAAMASLAAELHGRTVVTTSLAVAAARPIDWVFVLAGGQIVARGSPQRLRQTGALCQAWDPRSDARIRTGGGSR